MSAIAATFTLNVLMDEHGEERQEWELDGAITHEALLGRLDIVRAQIVQEALDEGEDDGS